LQQESTKEKEHKKKPRDYFPAAFKAGSSRQAYGVCCARNSALAE
jgi:hypothetical protein